MSHRKLRPGCEFINLIFLWHKEHKEGLDVFYVSPLHMANRKYVLISTEWFIVYRGKCAGELKTYPNTWNLLVTRAEKYIKRFNESLTTRTLRTTTKTRPTSPS